MPDKDCPRSPDGRHQIVYDLPPGDPHRIGICSICAEVANDTKPEPQTKEDENHPAWSDFRLWVCPAWTNGKPTLPIPLPDNWQQLWSVFKSGWECCDESRGSERD